jgi:hypothetical protein
LVRKFVKKIISDDQKERKESNLTVTGKVGRAG